MCMIKTSAVLLVLQAPGRVLIKCLYSLGIGAPPEPLSIDPKALLGFFWLQQWEEALVWMEGIRNDFFGLSLALPGVVILQVGQYTLCDSFRPSHLEQVLCAAAHTIDSNTIWQEAINSAPVKEYLYLGGHPELLLGIEALLCLCDRFFFFFFRLGWTRSSHPWIL